MLIYKIVPRRLWSETAASGSFTGASIDVSDGFIHFSSDVQVRDTARLHFAGASDLLLVAVSAEVLGPALRWEPSRNGALFPHLYAPLLTDQVAWVAELPLGPDGHHRFPPDVP